MWSNFIRDNVWRKKIREKVIVERERERRKEKENESVVKGLQIII